MTAITVSVSRWLTEPVITDWQIRLHPRNKILINLIFLNSSWYVTSTPRHAVHQQRADVHPVVARDWVNVACIKKHEAFIQC